MVQSKYTTVQGLNGELSTQRNSRDGRKIDRIILHHQASTNGMGGVRMMVKRTKQVSANYVVLSDGAVVLVVPEEYRAWTSASASWDGRAITFEVENSTGEPNWLISAKAEEKLAQMVVDIATRYNFPINRDTVIGHRELYSRYGASYATACPGGMRLDWIVNRANEIKNNPGSIPNNSVAPKPQEEDIVMDQKTIEYFDNRFGSLEGRTDTLKQNDDNIGERINRLEDTVRGLIREEGRNLRVYRQKSTNLHVLAAPGFWWELGNDFKTNEERQNFGSSTADLFRKVGWAQDFVRDLEDNEWEFYRGAAQVFPVNNADKKIEDIKALLETLTKK
jgi:hypothetical protein